MKLKQTALAICLLFFLGCIRAQTQAINADSPIVVLLGIFAALRSAPTFDPAPGTFANSATITINHRNKVPVRYTIDGTTTPSCSVGEVYDEDKKLTLPLGKYTLQAAECFEGFSSLVGKGDYSITGSFSYNGLINGNLYFNTVSTLSYSPTGLDPTSTYRFTISPALPSCITLNATTGVLTGACLTAIGSAVYSLTASRQNGNKEDLLFPTNIFVAQWAQEAYLKAPNAEANDNFGVSVSNSGDTIVVGAWGEDSNQTTITNGTTASANNTAADSGAAYVFRRTGTTWASEAYLKAFNAETPDNFGISVSISGDTIIVGAYQEASTQTTITNGTAASANNSAASAGAAYVFQRTGTSWVGQAYLKAPNAEANDTFGLPVSISGDTIVVGAYQEDSNQTTITNGNTASANNTVSNSGAAYVFRRTGTTWANEAYLKAPNAETTDFFGYAVSISGDTIVIGAYQEDSNQTTITNGTTASANNTAADSGAAYVFRRTGTTWANEAYLKAPNAETTDFFGYAVSISGDTIAVGAFQEDSNQTTITNGTTASANNTASNSGAVYVYRRSGSTWTNEAYLKAPNPDANDNFGYAVSISGDSIVVAANNEASNQTTITNGTTASSNNSLAQTGAAYAFRRSGNIWTNEAYIKTPNPDLLDQFGISISVSDDTILVGATGEASNQTTITNGSTASANNSATSAGAAYVFRLR